MSITHHQHFHYETQPVPGPLSWRLHHLPGWVHSGEVLVNHAVELVLPWAMLFGRRATLWGGGVAQIAFQVRLLTDGLTA